MIFTDGTSKFCGQTTKFGTCARWLLLLALLLVLAACAGTGGKTIKERGESQAAPKPDVDPKIQKEYDAALAAMREGGAGGAAKAKQILKNMTVVYPDLPGPYVNLGIIHFRAGELDQAESMFNQALEKNSDNAVSLNHLGIIYRGRGEFDKASEKYEKALDADPEYANAHLNYGILLDLYLGKHEKALHHYERFQELVGEEDKEVKNWIIDLQRRIKSASR